MIGKYSNLPRKSSPIFSFLGKSSEIFRKCSETFVWQLDNFWRICRHHRKVVGKLQKIVKTSFSLCLYDKQCHFSILTVIPSWISFPRLALCHFLSRKLEVETNSKHSLDLLVYLRFVAVQKKKLN